jgi:uncharacterized protein
MFNMSRIFIVVIVLCLIDFYVFRTFQNQFSALSNYLKYSIYSLYWSIPILIIILTFYFFSKGFPSEIKSYKLIFFVTTLLVLFYLPKLFIIAFQLIEDLGKIIAWLINKMSKPEGMVYLASKSVLRSFVVGRIGLLISIIPFLSVIYGVAFGRYNFNVNHINLSFKNLPPAFDGLKIVQFSDFHTGSLDGHQDKFRKAFEIINKQNPDILVFTGDMVNNYANEAVPWIALISDLKAKYAKLSILGNHDYGDYSGWPSEEAKKANLDKLTEYHKKMGFNLLLNQAFILKRDSQSIAILGVENWGEKPFPQYGKLDLAIEEAKNIPFKILLSHDPTHWQYQVKGKNDIALTLSGHTHAMQLAINIGGFSWSPVSIKYPRWKGLYSENGQYLYVNIGLGYIGFPGRVGANPEITVFELKRK